MPFCRGFANTGKNRTTRMLSIIKRYHTSLDAVFKENLSIFNQMSFRLD